MKRATITIPDDLEVELDAYINEQETPPSLTNVVQAALRIFLEQRKWAERSYSPAKKPLKLTVYDKGSGKKDLSKNHDKYFDE